MCRRAELTAKMILADPARRAAAFGRDVPKHSFEDLPGYCSSPFDVRAEACRRRSKRDMFGFLCRRGRKAPAANVYELLELLNSMRHKMFQRGRSGIELFDRVKQTRGSFSRPARAPKENRTIRSPRAQLPRKSM